jgi:probable rRNA maturation factor
LNELPDDGEIMLGDVIICRQRAEEQAEEFGHSVEREMVYLFVHSVCHLLGYDHMEDEEKAEMRAKEESVMEQINVTR